MAIICPPGIYGPGRGPDNTRSLLVPEMSPKQCRERYHQYLRPPLNNDPISAQEGKLIEQLVEDIGMRLVEIARQLGNRSDNVVKNWWNASINRRKRAAMRQNRDQLLPTAIEVPRDSSNQQSPSLVSDNQSKFLIFLNTAPPFPLGTCEVEHRRLVLR